MVDLRKLFFIMLTAASTLGTARVNAIAPTTPMSAVAAADSLSGEVYEAAQFSGGDEACIMWLRDHIKYPGFCQEQGVMGRVVVSFVVNRDGSIVDAKIERSPDQHLSDEALRVVKAMPKWKPARLGNGTARTYFQLSVMFRLVERFRGRIEIESLTMVRVERGDIIIQNPRGTYKLTGIRYTNSKKEDVLIDAPIDQYKLCTDDITLTIRVIDGKLNISQLDEVFNFTGDGHENDTTAHIFDSNAEHFTLKWFSHEKNITHFPYRTWCYEYYKSEVFSPEAKRYFDMLGTAVERDKKNPFIGSWVGIGQLDELNNAKKNVAILYERFQKEGRVRDVYAFMPEFSISSNSLYTRVHELEYKKKNRIIDWQDREVEVKWITDDCFAIAVTDDFGQKDWEIYYRKSDSTPLQDIIDVRTYWSKRSWRMRGM